MKAAKLNDRPSFPLMGLGDIQSHYYMQMPLWLFSDPRYAELNLDAKVAYTFLLNRFQLSRRNGWVNESGEVFVIFPRKELAQELRICEKRVSAAIRILTALELVWEKRCGLGDANQIYLAAVRPQHDPEYQCAPFQDPVQEDTTASVPEPSNPPFQNRQIGGSAAANPAAPEPPYPPSRNNNIKKTEKSHFQKVSQSVQATGTDGQTDDEEEEELMDILDGCELYSFSPEQARVFENAIERLYYSDSVRIGSATLPRSRVRAKLKLLDGMVLQIAQQKLVGNLDRPVKNSTQYVMTTIFNAIAESESDWMVDPDHNSLIAEGG